MLLPLGFLVPAGQEACTQGGTPAWDHSALLPAGRWLVLPLSHSVVPRRAATEVAAFRVGAAIIAWVLGGRALIHVVAGAGELVEGEPRGTGTLVTPQGVVAGGRAAGIRVGTFVLIWEQREKLFMGQGR